LEFPRIVVNGGQEVQQVAAWAAAPSRITTASQGRGPKARLRHRLPTINLPFEQWTEILGNERMTGALLADLTPSRTAGYESSGNMQLNLSLPYSSKFCMV